MVHHNIQLVHIDKFMHSECSMRHCGRALLSSKLVVHMHTFSDSMNSLIFTA